VSVLFVTLALVALALGAYLAAGAIRDRWRERPRRSDSAAQQRFDPGTERRAERKARTLLHSIVNDEEWEMYRDLGFIRVHGAQTRARGSDESYGYLIYPHKPIVAYMHGSNSLLSEYCVEFPDRDENLYGPKLPDSDDVLAKWMMIKADEERLIRGANMHLPGRQVDPQQVRRDLWRLAEWERSRLQSGQTRAQRRPLRSPDGAPDGTPATSAS
jgi:hypothetical protein